MIFFTPVIVRYMKKSLDMTKPCYSKQILPVPWPFVLSRFRCNYSKVYPFILSYLNISTTATSSKWPNVH